VQEMQYSLSTNSKGARELKDKITLTNPAEILYIATLIGNHIKQIEMDLETRQKFLRKFKDDVK